MSFVYSARNASRAGMRKFLIVRSRYFCYNTSFKPPGLLNSVMSEEEINDYTLKMTEVVKSNSNIRSYPLPPQLAQAYGKKKLKSFRLKNLNQIFSLNCWQLICVSEAAIDSNFVNRNFWKLISHRGCEICEFFSPGEVVRYLSCLAKARMGNQKLLDRLTTVICQNMPSFNVAQICLCIEAYAALNGSGKCIDIFKSCSRILPEKMRFISAEQLVTLLDSYAKLLIIDDNLLPYFSRILISRKGEFSQKQIISLFRSFATLQFRDLKLFDDLSQVLEKNGILSLDLEALSILIESYVELDLSCSDIIDAAFTKLNEEFRSYGLTSDSISCTNNCSSDDILRHFWEDYEVHQVFMTDLRPKIRKPALMRLLNSFEIIGLYKRKIALLLIPFISHPHRLKTMELISCITYLIRSKVYYYGLWGRIFIALPQMLIGVKSACLATLLSQMSIYIRLLYMSFKKKLQEIFGNSTEINVLGTKIVDWPPIKRDEEKLSKLEASNNARNTTELSNILDELFGTEIFGRGDKELEQPTHNLMHHDDGLTINSGKKDESDSDVDFITKEAEYLASIFSENIPAEFVALQYLHNLFKGINKELMKSIDYYIDDCELSDIFCNLIALLVHRDGMLLNLMNPLNISVDLFEKSMDLTSKNNLEVKYGDLEFVHERLYSLEKEVLGSALKKLAFLKAKKYLMKNEEFVQKMVTLGCYPANNSFQGMDTDDLDVECIFRYIICKDLRNRSSQEITRDLRKLSKNYNSLSSLDTIESFEVWLHSSLEKLQKIPLENKEVKLDIESNILKLCYYRRCNFSDISKSWHREMYDYVMCLGCIK